MALLPMTMNSWAYHTVKRSVMLLVKMALQLNWHAAYVVEVKAFLIPVLITALRTVMARPVPIMQKILRMMINTMTTEIRFVVTGGMTALIRILECLQLRRVVSAVEVRLGLTRAATARVATARVVVIALVAARVAVVVAVAARVVVAAVTAARVVAVVTAIVARVAVTAIVARVAVTAIVARVAVIAARVAAVTAAVVEAVVVIAGKMSET